LDSQNEQAYDPQRLPNGDYNKQTRQENKSKDNIQVIIYLNVNKEGGCREMHNKSESSLGQDVDQGGINPKIPANHQVSSHSLQNEDEQEEEDECSLKVADESNIPIKTLVYHPKLSLEARKKAIERSSQYFKRNQPLEDFKECLEIVDCTDEFEESDISVNKLYASMGMKKPNEKSALLATSLPVNCKTLKPPHSSLKVPSNKRINCQNTKILPKYFRNCGCSSILIVDDSPFNLLILKEIFKKIFVFPQINQTDEGSPKINIDEATNGLKALNMVKDSINKT